MATITLSTDNMKFIRVFENLARALDVPFERKDKSVALSKTMQRALDDEKKGRVTKLVNHKNAVAEILK